MSEPNVIAVTGASGLVGRELVAQLEAAGCLVRSLVRRPVKDAEKEIYWKPSEGQIDAEELNGVDAVVHLAGENIAAVRWTESKKKRIVDSRIEGTRLLSQTLAELPSKPSVLVSASAIGYYGDRGDTRLDESSPAGDGFLAETCVAWEAATAPAQEAGIRTVLMRTGLVLSPEGGLMGTILPVFKWGLGGVVGSGDQYMSWITLGDLARSYRYALNNEALQGPVNATAPHPVTNREFTAALGAAVRRPTIFPVPAFALRLATGEVADEMILASVNALPQRLLDAGFEFQDPELDPALQSVLAD